MSQRVANAVIPSVQGGWLGIAALGEWAGVRPHLIFQRAARSWMRASGSSGYELVKELRKRPDTGSVPAESTVRRWTDRELSSVHWPSFSAAATGIWSLSFAARPRRAAAKAPNHGPKAESRVPDFGPQHVPIHRRDEVCLGCPRHGKAITAGDLVDPPGRAAELVAAFTATHLGNEPFAVDEVPARVAKSLRRPVGELSALQLEPATVVRILELKGWIAKCPSPSDQRQTVWGRTKATAHGPKALFGTVVDVRAWETASLALDQPSLWDTVLDALSDSTRRFD